jgi:hypothetical protein
MENEEHMHVFALGKMIEKFRTATETVAPREHDGRVPLYRAGKDGPWPRDLAAHYEQLEKGSVSDDPTAGLIPGDGKNKRKQY